MLRDKNLVPLSHQHQHALGLCVRIGKAFEGVRSAPEIRPWEEEIARFYDTEMKFHFEAEEKILFPAAYRQEELLALVDELRIEHTILRRMVERARARQFTTTDLQVFTASLSEHIRKEERELFERLQELMSEEELSQAGAAIDEFFREIQIPRPSGR